MPERIRLRRVKGWRKPADAIVVARPTKWGNPFVVHEHTARCGDQRWCPLWTAADALDAVDKFRHLYLYPCVGDPPHPSVDEIRDELAGHDVACWCKLGEPCHGDLLLHITAGLVPEAS